MSRRECLDDRRSRRGGGQAERQRDADKRTALLPADTGRRSQDAKSWLDALDSVEQRGRRLEFVGAANDGAHLQVPVHLDVDFLNLAEYTQLIDVFAQTPKALHGERTPACLALVVGGHYHPGGDPLLSTVF